MNLVAEEPWRRMGRLGPLAPPRQKADVQETPGRPCAAGSARYRRQAASFRDIGALENMCGGALPRDFVEFLRQDGPLAPPLRFFSLPEQAGGGPESVQHFFGFGLSVPVCNLNYALSLYGGAIPAGVALIGGNGGGDYICLDLRGSDAARRAPVALWRVGAFWETGVWREEDLIQLAPSFSDFLGQLRATPGCARSRGAGAPRRNRAPEVKTAPLPTERRIAGEDVLRKTASARRG